VSESGRLRHGMEPTGGAIAAGRVLGLATLHLDYVPLQWCLNEGAYRWRVTHSGRRAARPVQQARCAGHASLRYMAMNNFLRWPSRLSSARMWRSGGWF
jgi:hypothetical protein